MESLTRARHIKSQMSNIYYWGMKGGPHNIYWDKTNKCFRVMRNDSVSLYKWPNHYEFVE